MPMQDTAEMCRYPRHAGETRRRSRASLRDAERRAFEAEAAYETLLGQVPGAIYAYAPELGGPTLSVSAYVEELLGVPAERFLVGDEVWDELLHPDDRERAWADYESFLRTGTPDAGDYRYIRPDGRWCGSTTAQRSSGSRREPLLIQGVMFDITATKETALRMQHLAYHDVLTGLPNRAMFQDHLEFALARSRRHGLAVAVLFLDLDDFKPINDTHGHDVGDEVLQGARRGSEARSATPISLLDREEMSSSCCSQTWISQRTSIRRPESFRRRASGSRRRSRSRSSWEAPLCRSARASGLPSFRSVPAMLVRCFVWLMSPCMNKSGIVLRTSRVRRFG